MYVSSDGQSEKYTNIHIKGSLTCIVLYYELLISKSPHVLTGDHTVLAVTHTFIPRRRSHTCLYSPAAEHHGTFAGTHFPPQWG